MEFGLNNGHNVKCHATFSSRHLHQSHHQCNSSLVAVVVVVVVVVWGGLRSERVVRWYSSQRPTDCAKLTGSVTALLPIFAGPPRPGGRFILLISPLFQTTLTFSSRAPACHATRCFTCPQNTSHLRRWKNGRLAGVRAPPCDGTGAGWVE